MCAGMCTMWPAPGISAARRSACGSARSGVRRRLDRVDVQVDRARRACGLRLSTVSSVADDVGAAALGLGAARFPVVPGLRVHRRLGVQRLDRVVGREARRDRPSSRRRRRRRAARARPSGRPSSACSQRLDQRALLGARLAFSATALAERGQRRRVRLRHHRRVDVGPEHQRLAPEAHRAGRVELLRRLERALRLGVVEAEGEAQALVEVGLGLRLRVVTGNVSVPRSR